MSRIVQQVALTGTGAQCRPRDVVTQITDDGDIRPGEDNGIALTTNYSPLSQETYIKEPATDAGTLVNLLVS